MKKTKQHIGLLLAALFAVGLSSCVKEDYADSSSKGTATVNLVFDTRASGQDGEEVEGSAEEGIKKLRVIVLDTDENRVDINEMHNFSDAPANVKTLTIMGLSTGHKSFYVVANEEAAGLNLGSPLRPGTSFVAADTTNFLQQLITDTEHTYFPHSGLPAAGLPIAGTASMEIVEGQDQTITIPITRAVAKFVLYVKNESKQDFTISTVNFGSFIADRTRLFPMQSAVTDIVYNTQSYPMTCGTTVSADADGTDAVFTGYIYETGSNLQAEAFTLSLSSPTPGFTALATPVQIKFAQEGRTAINRNEQVEITATVNVNREVEVDDLEILVVPWDEKEIEVPAFQ